ncbi:FAD/NAD(P)-binding domain-containing protein [Microthyrium microscopicum]|uniref:FAD/NAD(P)-binding domain-containing protein n=1 Tax=Microthyrium microscopicum TaxID=703497 RepID=A0A6A6U0R3_9PEZI|nr:FAD/NAD(P)-binding domain-containing protein [Microthyrium microscopicum]
MDQTKTSTPQKNIVILGGSYCGISIAHYTLKHTIPVLTDNETYQVIIVSTASQALCRPACPRALISDDLLPQEKLFVNIPVQFEQYPSQNFRFVQGTATELDHVNRTVSVSVGIETERIGFYALVIATGASTPSPLLGLNKDEQYLRSSWAAFRSELSSAKSIVISGGGASGVETAGELGEYLNGSAGWFNSTLESPKVAITLVTAGSEILPGLRPSIARKAEVFLACVGVNVIKNTRINAVEPSGAGTKENVATRAKAILADGKTLEADLYIPATGTTPNTNFVDKSLLEADGRVKVNAALRVEKVGERVYAIGDASSFARPAIHQILNAVPILGSNIKRDLLLAAGMKAVGDEKLFKADTRETQLVPIGRNKGVGAAMGWQIPSWLVWMIKGRDYWLWTTGDLWSGKQWAKET